MRCAVIRVAGLVLPALCGCVGAVTDEIPAFPEETLPGVSWTCVDEAVLCVHDPGAGIDDSGGTLTFAVCIDVDLLDDGELPESYRQGGFGYAPECESGILLDRDDTQCEQVKGETCELEESHGAYRYDYAYQEQIAFCGSYACEAGEACSCPECEGNAFCWPDCEHSSGDGTLCDAPGGRPDPSGTWCCPGVLDCTEAPLSTCEPI